MSKEPEKIANVVDRVLAPLADFSAEAPGGPEDPREAAAIAAKAALEAERVAAAQRGRRMRLLDWGVPRKDLDRVFGGELLPTDAMSSAKLYPDKTILVLSGANGCGKTTAAAWWIAQRGPVFDDMETRDPLFVSAPHLCRYSRYNVAEMHVLEMARRLVIDDLGTEYMDDKGHFCSFLDGLINVRYANELPTLITTNLPAAEFRERLGERIADRIREVGRCVESAEPSLRGA